MKIERSKSKAPRRWLETPFLSLGSRRHTSAAMSNFKPCVRTFNTVVEPLPSLVTEEWERPALPSSSAGASAPKVRAGPFDLTFTSTLR